MKIIINAIKEWVNAQIRTIKAQIEVVPDEEFIAWLNEENIVSPVATASGELYVTNNNEIYVL
jgi:hypothetical protein